MSFAGKGFLLIDVETHPCDPPFDDRAEERRLVDNGSPRDVEQDRRRFQAGDLRRADQMSSILVYNTVQGDEVGRGQHDAEIALLLDPRRPHRLRIRIGIVCEDAGAKSRSRHLRLAATDAAGR